jgi:hypothetical protein
MVVCLVPGICPQNPLLTDEYSIDAFIRDPPNFMADSVRLIIHLPNSFEAGSVRRRRRKNAKLEAKHFSHAWTSCQAVAPIIEIFVLLLFVLVAVVAIVGCFIELSHLLVSDALGHLAAKALQGGT